MDERRRTPRQRSLLGGRVIFHNHNCTMDCTVRNITPAGALIVSPESYRMPEKFALAIPARDEEFRAAIVWRKGQNVGLTLSETGKAREERRRPTPHQMERARLRELTSVI